MVAELAAAPSPAVVAPGRPPDFAVDELLLVFWRHAEGHYRHPDGTPTRELGEYRRAFGPVRRLYGRTPAAGFGPLALQAVGKAMVEAGWCRTRVNKQVGRVRRAFKWAAGQELVPGSVPDALKHVAGLQRGRTDAKERDPGRPVDPAVVDATLPFPSRHVRGLVAFCRLTGCRPGEARRLTRAQIDTAGDPWVHRPVQHKGRHRGKDRAVPLGPRARALLDEFPTASTGDPLFSPKLAREERYAANRARRKPTAPPSQAYRRKADPRRKPRDRYSADAFAATVYRAAKRAGVGPWHPNQLRHLFGTEVRRRFGLEAAQVALEHERADVTRVYAEKNLPWPPKSLPPSAESEARPGACTGAGHTRVEVPDVVRTGPAPGVPRVLRLTGLQFSHGMVAVETPARRTG